MSVIKTTKWQTYNKQDGVANYYWIFNEQCDTCGAEMEEIVEIFEQGNSQFIYWCPECGTLVDFNDCYEIKEDNWKKPLTNTN